MTFFKDLHSGSDMDGQGLFSMQGPVSSSAYVREIWRRRDFTLSLPIEELQASHRDTFLGNIWHLGNPLLSAGIYYLIFGKILDISRGVENFAVYLIIGVFTYQLTSRTILGGASSIIRRQGLMNSFRFPRGIIPISNAISELMSFAFQFLIMIAFAFSVGAWPSRRWLLLPLILVIHTAFNLGGSFIAARLSDGLRDMQQLIPFVFRLLMYISGVMIPVEEFLGKYALLDFMVDANPMVHLINFYRWAILGTDLNIGLSVPVLVESFVILWFGLRFFRGAEYRYGKV